MVELLHGISASEIRALEKRFGSLSPAVRQLLQECSRLELKNPGNRLPVRIDVGEDYNFGWDVLPRGIPIAGDGFGNTWVADASTSDGEWSPILFVSHDPAVVVVQAPDFPEFVRQALSEQGALDVIRPHVDSIWDDRRRSDFVRARDLRESLDTDLRAFAEMLESDWVVADLRSQAIGSGFALTSTEVVKHPRLLIFGFPPPRRSLLSRLLGRA